MRWLLQKALHVTYTKPSFFWLLLSGGEFFHKKHAKYTFSCSHGKECRIAKNKIENKKQLPDNEEV